jgi:hypothetical protein
MALRLAAMQSSSRAAQPSRRPSRRWSPCCRCQATGGRPRFTGPEHKQQGSERVDVEADQRYRRCVPGALRQAHRAAALPKSPGAAAAPYRAATPHRADLSELHALQARKQFAINISRGEAGMRLGEAALLAAAEDDAIGARPGWPPRTMRCGRCASGTAPERGATPAHPSLRRPAGCRRALSPTGRASPAHPQPPTRQSRFQSRHTWTESSAWPRSSPARGCQRCWAGIWRGGSSSRRAPARCCRRWRPTSSRSAASRPAPPGAATCPRGVRPWGRGQGASAAPGSAPGAAPRATALISMSVPPARCCRCEQHAGASQAPPSLLCARCSAVVDHPGTWEDARYAYLHELLISRTGHPAAVGVTAGALPLLAPSGRVFASCGCCIGPHSHGPETTKHMMGKPAIAPANPRWSATSIDRLCASNAARIGFCNRRSASCTLR